MPSCPICSQTVQNLVQHVLKSNCKSLIIQQYAASIKFTSGSICKYCDRFFTKQTYTAHSKSCSRSIKSKSRAASVQSYVEQNIQIDLLKKKRKLQSTPNTAQISYQNQNTREFLPSALLDLSKTKLTFFIKAWLQQHNSMNQIVLYKIYDKYIDKMTNSLDKIIPEVKISDLYSIKKKIPWATIVKKPEELFDSALIINRIRTITQNLKQQNKILSALNTFYQKFHGTFTPFQLNKISKQLPENPRNKQPLMPETLFQVVKWLFSSKIRQLVHFGIDLLLIFQSGLRFPSSIGQINTTFLSKLAKTKQGCLQYETIQTKTQTKFVVIIDSQLVHLMNISGWKGLTFKKEVYERMTKFLQFTLYSLRRGFLSFVILQNSKTDMQTARHLSQHTSATNLNFYVQSIIKGQLKKIKENLRMSGIIGFSAKDYEPQKDIKFQVFQLSQNWKQKCWNYLINLVNQSDKLQVLQTSEQFVIPEKPQQIKTGQQQQENQERVSSSSQSQIQKTRVKIRHLFFQMTNGLFSLSSLYSATQSPCSKKDQQHQETKYKCNQCYKVYCQLCQNYPFCPCFQLNTIQKQTFLSAPASKIKLTMPNQYIGENTVNYVDFLQIRFLIHARGYYFTNVCVEHEEVTSINIPNVQEINLPDFDQYISLRYFPPIKVALFGDQSIEGQGFGIFATQDIEPNVFIGQYAADKLPIRLQRFIHRKDMIFDLGQKFSDNSVVIGPRNYCGYVPLINQDRKKANCQSITALVKGKIRIILYTLKKILCDQQLFYDYGRDVNVPENMDIKQLNEEKGEESQRREEISNQKQMEQLSIQEIIQPNQPIKPRVAEIKIEESQYLKIKNKQNCCFMIVIVQLFYAIRQQISIPETNDPVVNIFKKMIELSQKKIEMLAEEVYEDNKTFRLWQQNDAHQFYLYIIKKLSSLKVYLSPISIDEKTKIQCSLCKWTHNTQHVQYNVQMTMSRNFQTALDYESSAIDYICGACKRKNNAKTRTSYHFWQETKYILITLVRFLQNTSKNTQFKHLADEIKYQDSTLKLKLIICHYGSIESGHYYIYDYQQRVKLDCNSVKGSQTLNLDEPYMLLYERVQNSK